MVQLTVSHGGTVSTPSHDLVPVHGPAIATVRVNAAPWVPVQTVRLVQDGVVVFSKDISSLGPSMQGEWTIPFTLTADSWMVAEAGWNLDNTERPSAPYADVAPGHYPIGFTNPIWLDWGGDGR